MEVTEIWIRIFISRTLFPFFLCRCDIALGSFSFYIICGVCAFGFFSSLLLPFLLNGLTLTHNIHSYTRIVVDWRFKMPLLPAEQIGSGRWFNDCFWHPAILLLHWISNISIVWLALCRIFAYSLAIALSLTNSVYFDIFGVLLNKPATKQKNK